MAVKQKVATTKKTVIEYTCLCCGYKKNETEFFISKWSKVWNESGKRVLFCKDCINTLFVEFTNRFKSEETALKICCAYLDVPFFAALYQSIAEKNSFFNVGLYLRQLQMRQYQYKSFHNSLVDGELSRADEDVREEREARWTKKDKQNMNYVLSIVGYDPFDDSGMTDNDRRYCFNILAGYCDTDGIKEDGHKLQSCIQITNSQLQCKKFDEIINQELLTMSPNEQRIKGLTTSKKQLLDSISKTAQDNNISSAHNSSSRKGINTLTAKMKEIEKEGYEQIKVNLFDVNTAECMKQIADLSNESIMEQLTFDNNDYSEMLKEQRELLVQCQDELDHSNEENRMLKNKIIDLEKSKSTGKR